MKSAVETALTAPVTLTKVQASYATAPFNVRQQIAADTTLMGKIKAALSVPDWLRVSADLGYRATGGTIAHTATKVADEKIREQLGAYVTQAVQAGSAVEGQVVVLSGQDWLDAYYDQFPNELPRGGPTDDEPSTNAYVTRKRGVVIVLNTSKGNAGTTVHEGLHLYSKTTLLDECGSDINEGFTELFARKVTTPMGISRTNYESNFKLASALEGAVGEDKMAKAYFHGELQALKDAFAAFRKTKGDTDTVAAGRWTELVGHARAKRWTNAGNLCK